ncbi:MAG: hypothetical protein ABI678_15655, partial [Kofleriaceae bacterium]
ADPGWQVTVDGEERMWVAADVLRRAVATAAGAHHVRWRYDRRDRTTLVIVLAGLALLLALAIPRR